MSKIENLLKQELPPQELLDPLFEDIFESYLFNGNIRMSVLQKKINTYIDARIDKYFEKKQESDSDPESLPEILTYSVEQLNDLMLHIELHGNMYGGDISNINDLSTIAMTIKHHADKSFSGDVVVYAEEKEIKRIKNIIKPCIDFESSNFGKFSNIEDDKLKVDISFMIDGVNFHVFKKRGVQYTILLPYNSIGLSIQSCVIVIP